MEKKEKDLLLKDLCARLPYGVNAETVDMFGYTGKIHISADTLPALDKSILLRCKPYLRPMSDMSEEEAEEYDEVCIEPCLGIREYMVSNFMDWLNAHHFDYRGLIERGLALEAHEGMYK